MKRVAGRAAGLLAKVKLELRPLIAKPGQHRWQQERRDGRDDAHPKFAMERPSLGAGGLGEFLGFAKNLHRLVGYFFAEAVKRTTRLVRSTSIKPSKSLQLAKARGKGGLGNEAGIGRLAKMAEAAKRDQILKLFDRRQMDNH